MYAATSCTDKTLAIYEYETGELAANMFGHSELVTGLKFTNDCKHLVSVSGKQYLHRVIYLCMMWKTFTSYNQHLFYQKYFAVENWSHGVLLQ